VWRRSNRAAHGEAEGGDGGARRRRSSGCNWKATGGRRARVSNGEACMRVDWCGGCLVVAAHGDAVRCRSRRGTAAVECGSGAREMPKALEE
jgi:hypothetical protein